MLCVNIHVYDYVYVMYVLTEITLPQSKVFLTFKSNFSIVVFDSAH